MKFTPPNPDDHESTPQMQITRSDGSVLKAYKHKTEPHRYRITINDEPYNPTKIFADAITKGLIKKK